MTKRRISTMALSNNNRNVYKKNKAKRAKKRNKADFLKDVNKISTTKRAKKDAVKTAKKPKRHIFGSFKESALELKDIRCLVVTAMLIALELALKGLTLHITDDLKVSVAFITKAATGMLYGPTVAFIEGIVSDTISFMIKPTGAFSPLFTLQEGFAAMLYGLFLYKLKLTRADLHDKTIQKQSAGQILRIVLAKLSVAVCINLFYTPLALIITNSMAAGQFVYGSTLTGYPARLLKNAIQFPVDCILLIAFLPIVSTAYNLVFKRNNSHKTGVSVDINL